MMRKTVEHRSLKSLMLTAVMVLWSFASTASADTGKALLDSLHRNPKLMDSSAILETFELGNPTVRIIAGLKADKELEELKKLEDKGLIFEKNDLKLISKMKTNIKNLRTRVLKKIDTGKSEVKNTFYFIPAIAFETTLEGLGELAALEDISRIDFSGTLKANTAQGIPLMNASNVKSTLGYNGDGIAVAIVDSGIDYTHPMLGGSSSATDFPNAKVVGGYDYGESDEYPMDAIGHGTSVAAIVAGENGVQGDYNGGVAHNAVLYALKVSDASGAYAYDNIAAAWDWCVNENSQMPYGSPKIRIINTSLGGMDTANTTAAACATRYATMNNAAERATAAGITIFASSGENWLCDVIQVPACLPDVISVGSVSDAAGSSTVYYQVDPSVCPDTIPYQGNYYVPFLAVEDEVPPYVNTSGLLDLLAPGNVAHVPTVVGGGLGGSGYQDFIGTSPAAAYAAGAAACLQSAAVDLNGLSSPYLTPAQVKEYLVNNGVQLADPKSPTTVVPRIDLQASYDDLELKIIHPEIGGTGCVLIDFEDNAPNDPQNPGLEDLPSDRTKYAVYTDWVGHPNATSYHVRISADQNTAYDNFAEADSVTNSGGEHISSALVPCKLPSSIHYFKDNTKYWFDLIAYTSGNTLYSGIHDFTAMFRPETTAPQNGSTAGPEFKLEWQQSFPRLPSGYSNTYFYELRYSTDPTFAAVSQQEYWTVNNRSMSKAGNPWLTNNVRYYWQVRVVKLSGGFKPVTFWSDSANFIYTDQ